MRRIKPRLLIFILTLGTTVPAAADVYSIDQAVHQALENNPDIVADHERSLAAKNRAAGARGALWPQLGVRYFARRSDNPLDSFADKLNTRMVDPAIDFTGTALNYPDPSTLNATELALTWSLYTGGKVSAAIRQADELSDYSRLHYERQQQVLAHRTRTAYFSAQAAYLGVAIAEDAAISASDHARTAARLTREGRSVETDQLTAELALASNESARVQAYRRRERALDELKILMGLPPQADVVLFPWQQPTKVEISALEELELRAFDVRKDLHAARAQQNAAQARIEEAKSAFLPHFSIVATNSWYADNAALDNKSQSVMGVLSINLFSGGRDSNEIVVARRMAAESNARYQTIEQTIRADLRAAYQDLTTAQARFRIATNIVDKARANVALVKKRYGEGHTTLLDLLMAERLLVETRNEELNAALLVKTAESALRLADGTLELPH